DTLYVLDRATQSSVHSYLNSLKNGFVTIAGGHRIGICGSAVMKDGEISSFRDFSSLSIRVAKEVKGISDELVSVIMNAGAFNGTLIISPPGGGKTTLLRDMIRILSETYRIGVADERSELAGVYRGNAQFDLGVKTDVIDSCPKNVSIMMLLRGMNPEIIAVDEITKQEDADALLSAHHCGVSLLATAHAENIRDIKEKPMYRSLIELDAFRNIVFIRKQGGERKYELVRVGERTSD
ncbi:MAG: ATPase, T2SS/T4P/T4SS family, partial [Clostridiales bacterium]|nr:ATPase, T2SS/T4P/T4SS family [Clostridiales bacterium]